MKMPRLATFVILATVLGIAGCSSGPSTDDAFVALANNYLDRMLELNPEWATNLGDHRFDDQISDMSETGFQTSVDFNRAYLDSLTHIDPGKLILANRIDYEILKERCEATIFKITEIQEYKWNPTMYNPGDGIYNILARDYAPLPEPLLSQFRFAVLRVYFSRVRGSCGPPGSPLQSCAFPTSDPLDYLLLFP